MAIIKSMQMNITEEQLVELVEEPFFSKGKDCFQEGLVELMKVGEGHVTGRAIGRKVYFQHLYFSEEDGCLDGECTCPAYNLYGPCKHMAAVGLALMAGDGEYEPSDAYIKRMAFLMQVEEMLMQKSKKELVGLLIDVINHDPENVFLLDEKGFLLMAVDDFWV